MGTLFSTGRFLLLESSTNNSTRRFLLFIEYIGNDTTGARIPTLRWLTPYATFPRLAADVELE